MDMRMAFTAVCSELMKWKELMNCVTNYKEKEKLFSVVGMHQIQSMYVELQFLMALFIDLEISSYEEREVNDMVSQITLLANQAHEIINSFMELTHLSNIVAEVRSIKTEVEKLYVKKAYMIGDTLHRAIVSSDVYSRLDINRPLWSTYYYNPMVNKIHIGTVYDEIDDLRKFIMSWKLTADEHGRVESLVDSIVRKASEVDSIIFFTKRHRPFGNILKEIKSINTKLWSIYSSTSLVIGNGSTTGVDFLLDNLKKKLMKQHKKDEYCRQFTEIAESLYQELRSLRTFLLDVEMIRHHHQRVQDLVNQILDLAYEAEDIIYSLNFCHDSSHRNLANILKEIESIQTAVAEIYQKKLYGVGDPQLINIMSSSNNTSCSSRNGDSIAEDETVVGFDSDVEMIKERLAGGSGQLDVISIVGMAGLGKTTLAKKLYNDPYVVYHFYIRGWTYVSQVYRRRDLLLGILTCFVENKDGIYSMSDDKLAEVLYKSLKCKRYLIVMDDVWEVRPWDDLRRCFPNDNNGSRIIITSRHTNVAVQVKSDSHPHPLRFLTEEESWDLFEQKAFWKESCPHYLVEKGREIVQKCGGLPLAIVVIAGLLSKTDKTLDWWRQVAESVSSYIASSPEQCMNTLALSYNHLPRHLKLCFLYFGAFPEDHEIRVTKLMCLWIAEGFIRQIGQRTFEDVAEEYLVDLTDRNLVLVSKKRSTGGIKACRVHDILRDLCLKKANEENFLQHINRHNEFSYSSSSSTTAIEQPSLFNNSSSTHVLRNALFFQIEKEVKSLRDRVSSSSSSSPCSLVPNGKMKRRVCINSSPLDYISSLNPPASHICTLLCFGSEECSLSPKDMSSTYGAFKVLKVLDLSTISISYFPLDILRLGLLKYLALQGKELSLPVSISDLRNLETLIVSKVRSGNIPPSIWKMVKLRHLRIGGENDLEFPEETDNDGFPSTLNNLQTISQVCPSSSLDNILARTRNLRKLVLCVNSSRGQHFSSLHLDFLNSLEVLYLLNRHRCGQLNSFKGFTFPPNLKGITLSNTGLQWKEMSILGMLPNLEALKLEYEACVGPRWDTSDGGFLKLKYLRIHYMNLQRWNTSRHHFANLRHLVLSRCKELKEIPSDVGNILTLHTVEVSWCSHSAIKSAWHIQEEQKSSGNDWLKILINHPEWEEQHIVLM